MATETPVYDLVLLLDADAPSERRAEILREVESAISQGGEIVGTHDWGVRNLAYEIDHHKEGEYHLLQLTGPSELLDRLRNALRVTDGVLRHRILRLPPGMPPPPALRPEPRAEPAASEAAPSSAEAAPAAEAAPPSEAAPAAEAAPSGAPAAESPPPTEAPPEPAVPAGEPEAPVSPPADAPGEQPDEAPAEAPSAS
jgi:small subunit ribosomal protein S6